MSKIVKGEIKTSPGASARPLLVKERGLKVYNTLGREKQEFKPIKNGRVLMYHCGPTVYWTQHIGNMRGMVMADLIVRTLEYLAYKVKLVRNYTDVGHLTSDADEGEDKMEKASRRENLDPNKIADKYIKIFENDIKELNVRSADKKPRATEMIKEVIKMIAVLIEKDFAYSTPLAIYFDVSKAKNYTQLSGQNLEANIKDAGKGDVSDSDKKNSADFALWFFKAGKHENALQYWSSPFQSSLAEKGQGFPGWHIECSVMCQKFLGKTIDIHMGGVEHIPVHHTNEIAQSEAANGVKFVNYWLHNEHLMVNNKKMAKSEGTGYALSEVKEKNFSPMALRYFFLQAHYRSKQNFTWEAMAGAQKGLDNLTAQILALGKKKGEINLEFKNKFIEKISDDFNIPGALAIVQELLKANLSPIDKLATILDFDQVLGLGLDNIKKEKKQTPEKYKKMARESELARQQGDYKKADELRNLSASDGYPFKNTPQGPEFL